MNIKSRPYIYILCTLALSCLFLDLHTIIGLKKEGFCDGFPFTIGFHLYSSSLFYISLLLSSLIQINNTRFLKTAITLFYYTFFAFRNEVNFYLILQVLEGFILSQCIYCILKYNIIKPIVFSIFPLYILSIFIFMYCSEKNYMLFLLIICFKDTKIEGTYKNIILYILPFIPISIIGFIISSYFISTKFNNNICYEQFFFSGVITFSFYI